MGVNFNEMYYLHETRPTDIGFTEQAYSMDENCKIDHIR